VIEHLDDVEANLRLLIGNQQEGNDPLDIGLNALDTVEKSKGGRGVTSELSVSGFARAIGKSEAMMRQVIKAAEVYQKLRSQLRGFVSTGKTQHLYEIHSAPSSTRLQKFSEYCPLKRTVSTHLTAQAARVTAKFPVNLKL
jgi:hypothetical protein